jgi:1,4-alpha-glucan branching enzyme
MFTHPGKKLLFMGCDIGQWNEWSHDSAVPWEILQYDNHRGLQLLVRELNRLYKAEPALHQVDFHYSGFEWIDFHDADNSVIAFLRRPEGGQDPLMICCNFTPVPRLKYRFGVPDPGIWEEILNTDSQLFWGSNMGNDGAVASEPVPSHGREHSIAITLPALAVLAFRRRQ